MSKVIKCPLCNSEVEQRLSSYHSGESDLSDNEIIVSDVKMNYCKNSECEHSWLPHSEEERIDLVVLQRSRNFLKPDQIAKIREALGFSTKTAASNFLTLNSKAFTKWEQGYTEPNTANDLLMRLAAFSEANFNFIKDLHNKKFAFDSQDYELICKSTNQEWNYKTINITSSTVDYKLNSGSLFENSQSPYALLKTAEVSTSISEYQNIESIGKAS